MDVGWSEVERDHGVEPYTTFSRVGVGKASLLKKYHSTDV